VITMSPPIGHQPKVLFVVNEDWAFLRFRRPLASALVKAGWEVSICCPAGDACAEIEASGYRVIRTRMNRGSRNPFLECRALIDLVRAYRTERPQIVHHFAAKPILYGSIAAAVSPVSAVVNSITGVGYAYSSDHWSRRLARLLFNISYRWALNRPNAKVVFLNGEDHQLFLNYGLCRPANSVVIGSEGIDTLEFSPSPEPSGMVTVLYGGRMLWDKGLHVLEYAARILHSRGVQAKILLAGVPDQSNPSSIPELLLREWSRDGFVHWIGFHPNMIELLRNAHVACLPSRREGVPTFLLEAAACGRPIVATDVPGCRDVVVPGTNGFLVPFGDPHRLAASLESLITDARLRVAMGHRSRQLVLERFSIEVVSERIFDLYGNALATAN